MLLDLLLLLLLTRPRLTSPCPALFAPPQVQWVEMPGSKIRFTSILHMAFELVSLKLAYQWLGLWRVAEETAAHGRINAPGRAKAS